MCLFHLLHQKVREIYLVVFLNSNNIHASIHLICIYIFLFYYYSMTEADVYVYGHLQAILESKLQNNVLMKTLEDYPKLTNFCLNFNQLHLGNKAMIWEFL